MQLGLDGTDLKTCLAGFYNISQEEVNSTHLEWADIHYGEEQNNCTITDTSTTHFPEVQCTCWVDLYVLSGIYDLQGKYNGFPILSVFSTLCATVNDLECSIPAGQQCLEAVPSSCHIDCFLCTCQCYTCSGI